MELLLAVAFLLPLGVVLYKTFLTRRRTPMQFKPEEASSGLWQALGRLFGNGRELALFALFEIAAVGALALSLAAFGPEVSIIAIMVSLALLILFAWKLPPKPR